MAAQSQTGFGVDPSNLLIKYIGMQTFCHSLQDLSHNQLYEIPPGIGFLIRLLDLNVSFNKLISIAPDISNCRGTNIFLSFLMNNNFAFLICIFFFFSFVAFEFVKQ